MFSNSFALSRISPLSLSMSANALSQVFGSCPLDLSGLINPCFPYHLVDLFHFQNKVLHHQQIICGFDLFFISFIILFMAVMKRSRLNRPPC